MAGRPSVPLRRPLSCPPPSTNGGSDRPGRMYSAPAPLIPWTLWAETEIRSAPSVRARNGTLKKPCTASVWNSAFGQTRCVSRAMRSMGMTAPDSLFTIMMLTRIVSGRRAACRASRLTRPSASGCRQVTEKPCCSSFCMGWSTAWCSTAVVTMWRPRLPSRSAAEKMAQLSASVPPEVKKTRSVSAPMASATSCRAVRSSRAASMPRRWTALGFPQRAVSASFTAATASAQGRVVAALSR